MTTNSPSPRPRRNTQRLASVLQPHVAVRIVWLRIAFSAPYPISHDAIDQRLCLHLRGTGFGCWMTDRAVALLGQQRFITPADWSVVIDWLLCQPEVVFVAREQPRSQRAEVCR